MVNPADIRCHTPTFCRRQASVLPFNRVESGYRHSWIRPFISIAEGSDKLLGRAVITKLWRCSSKRAVRQVFYRESGEKSLNGRLGIFASQASKSRGRSWFVSAAKLQARAAPTLNQFRSFRRLRIARSLSSKRALTKVFYQHDVRIFQRNFNIED